MLLLQELLQDLLLIYEADTQKWVGIASTAIGGAADELAAGCTGVDLTLSGDLNVSWRFSI